MQYESVTLPASTDEGVKYRVTKTAEGIVGSCICLGELSLTDSLTV